MRRPRDLFDLIGGPAEMQDRSKGAANGRHRFLIIVELISLPATGVEAQPIICALHLFECK